MAPFAVKTAGGHQFADVLALARWAIRLLVSKNQTFKILTTVTTMIFKNWHVTFSFYIKFNLMLPGPTEHNHLLPEINPQIHTRSQVQGSPSGFLFF
jgi:hypothetical protein